MLTVLMTAFLSFSIINGTDALSDDPYAASVASDITSGQISTYGSNDAGTTTSVNIPTGDFEINWWYEGLVGRHQMSTINSNKHLGIVCIKELTSYYSGNVAEDFTYSESITTVETNSISTSVKFGFEWAKAISTKINIAGVEAGEESGPTFEFDIENTTTYTYSKSTTQTVSFKVKQSLIEGKKFAVCVAADVYQIECSKWQYDNYWWGNYEVSGSRSTYYTYLALNPFVTIAYQDSGEVVK